MSSPRIDNSRSAVKIKIREDVCKNGYSVLDCYHGEGYLWGQIKKTIDLTIVGIEKEKGKGYGTMYGEAEKIIPSIDLSIYQIIDFDAWGSPYLSIKAMFKNKTLKKGTICFYTFIQTRMGGTQKELLENIGIKYEMYKKCRTIWRNYAFVAFCQFLLKNGITQVKNWHYQDGSSTKNYGYFIV